MTSILEKLKKAYVFLFQPDLFNYESLGNFIQHLHVHFIPRYKKPRVFARVKFVDGKWGHYRSPHKNRYVSKIILKNYNNEEVLKRLEKVEGRGRYK